MEAREFVGRPTKTFSVTFSCDIDFEVDATNEVDARKIARGYLQSWLSENAESSDFDVVKSVVLP